MKEGLATLTEIETSWSFGDLLEAHLVLAAYGEIERIVSEETRRQVEQKRR